VVFWPWGAWAWEWKDGSGPGLAGWEPGRGLSSSGCFNSAHAMWDF
jgi:hypothetical protein